MNIKLSKKGWMLLVSTSVLLGLLTGVFVMSLFNIQDIQPIAVIGIDQENNYVSYLQFMNGTTDFYSSNNATEIIQYVIDRLGK